MLLQASCFALVAQMSLVLALPQSSSNTTAASTSTASNNGEGMISSTSELLDYLSSHKDVTLGASNTQSNFTGTQIDLNALVSALTSNETSPGSVIKPITSSSSQVLTNPREGGVVRWEDWGMSFPRYREPRTSIEDAQRFAQCVHVAIGINQMVAGAGDFDQVENARFQFRGERRIFRPSLLATLAGDNNELSWIELKAFGELLMRWAGQFDSGTVPGTETILLDWHNGMIGFRVAGGAFLVQPTNEESTNEVTEFASS